MNKIVIEFDLDDISEDNDSEHLMLAILCAKEIIIILNDKLYVMCNDMFAWAMADVEEIQLEEVPALFDMWRAEQTWGDLKWVSLKRNVQPQQPVIDIIKANGCWDEVWEVLPYGRYNEYMSERYNERIKKEQNNV